MQLCVRYPSAETRLLDGGDEAVHGPGDSHKALLRCDGQQLVEERSCLQKAWALLVFPGGENDKAVVLVRQPEQLQQMGDPVQLRPALAVVPAGTDANLAQIAEGKLAGSWSFLCKQQIRHGADTDGIVAPFNGFLKSCLQIMIRLAWHGHGVPGKVPHGNGQFFGQVARNGYVHGK
ncbi:hypothetical protein D3C75_632190 [compost metagenome]